MNNGVLIDRIKRVLNLTEMLDQFASYPPSPFFTKQVERRKDMCEDLKKLLDKLTDSENESSETREEKGCTCGLHEYHEVIGTGHAREVFCRCQNKTIDYEVETKPLI